MRVVVVDDEPLARDELVFLLGQCPEADVDVVAEAASVHEALNACDQLRPDVVFTDLRMKGPDGIALAETLRHRSPDVQVVVVSAHDDGALRAFDARVADYLLKPVRLERLRETIRKLRPAQPGASDATPIRKIAVRKGDGYVVLDLQNVVYFEVKDLLVWAVTENDRYALDLPLAHIEEKLPADMFFRSHRGYLVQINCIAAIEPAGQSTFDLVLNKRRSERLPLARERARHLRKKIAFAG